MIRDLRFAVRRLLRSPGFSATVILLFGLTIGANASLFSVLYGLLFKPLPFAGSERVVTVSTLLANRGINVGLPVPFFDEAVAKTRTLEAVAGYRDRQLRSADADARMTTYQAALVQPGVLTMLGARPALGRLIVAEDTQDGAARSALISWDLWQARYAGADDAIGKSIELADGEFRIVGVLPRSFGFPRHTTQVWLPLSFSPAERGVDQAGAFGDLTAIARLRPQATLADAENELAALARGMAGLRDIIDLVGVRVEIKPLRDLWIGDRQGALQLMLLAVALVLLVATANVCNLYIARMLARRQELALLEALGAGPWRRLRQTIAETLTLCACGAAAGLAVIPLAVELLRRFDLVPGDAPQAFGLDLVTFAFTAALTVALALAMAGSSLWLQRGNLALAIRAGGVQTLGRGTQRARQVLIVTQIALTAALLVGVGLLLRSSQRLLAEEVGFDRNHLALSAIADLPASRPGSRASPADVDAANAATRLFVERCRALPGVTAVGMGTLAPFGWSMSVSNFALPGHEKDDTAGQAIANRSYVNADYFRALGTTLLRGRAFIPEETQSHGAVAIVDAKFARQVFPDRDALGQKFMMSFEFKEPMRELTVVGVVPTLKMQALDEQAQRPSVYLPEEYPLNGMLLLRTQSDPALLATPVKEIFHEVAPRARLRDVVPMRDRIADTLRDRVRLNALLELLGAMALALAAVGLYAVLAYAVRMRTAEFGVRMALGASRQSVLKIVLAQGTRLIVAGLLLALPFAYALARVLGARLYQVSAFDAVTLAAVAALLGTVALLACWLPARRAARVDPIEALRHE
ncbi:MAG TPA: ADOP family duplicated permease [Rudaea sp.]|jgi:predicted permease